jgi:hypothetical protein
MKDQIDQIDQIENKDKIDQIVNKDKIDQIKNKDQIEKIENKDLLRNQYDEYILKFNMENRRITPYMVLNHQNNLSNEFIFDYILNEKYAIFDNDYDITLNIVIGIYPNFAKFDIQEYIKNKKK